MNEWPPEWNGMQCLASPALHSVALLYKINTKTMLSLRAGFISSHHLISAFLLHFASAEDGYYIAVPSFHGICFTLLSTQLQLQYQILTLIQPPMASSNPKSKPKTKQPHNEPPSVSANFAKSSTSASSSIIDYDHEIYLQLTTTGNSSRSPAAKTPNQVYREVCI